MEALQKRKEQVICFTKKRVKIHLYLYKSFHLCGHQKVRDPVYTPWECVTVD